MEPCADMSGECGASRHAAQETTTDLKSHVEGLGQIVRGFLDVPSLRQELVLLDLSASSMAAWSEL